MSLIKSLFLILAISLSSIQSHANETTKDTYADVSVFSHYVWRGMKLSESTVVQPSLGVIYGNFGFNMWSNYDFHDKKHNETDFTFDYTFSNESLEVIIGYIYYAVDGPESSETSEYFVTASYDTFLSPFVSLYYDKDEGDGGFFEIGAEHTLALSDAMELSIGALVGYNLNNASMGTNEGGDEFSGLYNGEIYASIPFEVSGELYIEAMIAHSVALSDDSEYAIMDNSYDGDDSTSYVGISLSLSF